MSQGSIEKLLDRAKDFDVEGIMGEPAQLADAAREEYGALQSEIAWLQGWRMDLQSGLYINCVYCGHRYPPGTGAVMQDVLYEHIKQCSKHPLAKAEATIAALKQRVRELLRALVELWEEAEFNPDCHGLNKEDQIKRLATIERANNIITSFTTLDVTAEHGGKASTEEELWTHGLLPKDGILLDHKKARKLYDRMKAIEAVEPDSEKEK